MKHRIWRGCAAFLLAAVLCVQTAAALIRPEGHPTRVDEVLEVLNQYDAGAYHIVKTMGNKVMTYFPQEGDRYFETSSFIEDIATAVHETYHGYVGYQPGHTRYMDEYYLGGGKSYFVDYSIAYTDSAFINTMDALKDLPPALQTYRYSVYILSTTSAANVDGVFGLLDEWSAYHWNLEVMNSLAQYLIDVDAGAESWFPLVRDIGNSWTAYAEFKYWTLRYMLYVKSANPALYQAILDNTDYCIAYRDTDEKFLAEIERGLDILDSNAEYLRAKNARVDWKEDGVFLVITSPYFGEGVKLEDRDKLMAELEKAEYLEMDSILKAAASRQPETPPPSEPSPQAVLSPQKLTVNGAEVSCEKYNIGGSNYFKLRDVAFLLRDSEARFSVDWDEASQTVSITSGRTYTPDGSELVLDGVDKSGSAVESGQTVLVDGEAVSSLSIYNIGGNNYFKLRDLAGLLGFAVGYVEETNTATIAY